MEKRSTLYSYAIIAQPVHQDKIQNYLWQKCGKYKLLKHAEEALKVYVGDVVMNNLYKIVPYFEGYWWTDEEMKKQAYIKTNILLWEYLNKKGLADDARQYLKINNVEKNCTFTKEE